MITWLVMSSPFCTWMSCCCSWLCQVVCGRTAHSSTIHIGLLLQHRLLLNHCLTQRLGLLQLLRRRRRGWVRREIGGRARGRGSRRRRLDDLRRRVWVGHVHAQVFNRFGQRHLTTIRRQYVAYVLLRVQIDLLDEHLLMLEATTTTSSVRMIQKLNRFRLRLRLLLQKRTRVARYCRFLDLLLWFMLIQSFIWNEISLNQHANSMLVNVLFLFLCEKIS